VSAQFVEKKKREYIEFLARNLRPTLTALDLERAAAVRNVILWSALALPIGLVLAAFAFTLHENFGVFVGVVALGVVAYIHHHFVSPYRARFKQRVIGPLVRFYDESMQFSPDDGIDQGTFQRSGLFRSRIDSYASEDLVEGTLGATAVRFSEVTAKREERSGKNKREVTVFRGVFFEADFNKHFRGATYVLPDTAQKMFGAFGLGGLGQSLQSLDKSYGAIVKLEDPAFEREFVVYSSDQVEARYILSSALMERIVEFRQRCKRKVHLSFVGDEVYLAVESSKNLFEPPVFSALTTGSVEEYWADLQLFGGIVEQLNLNTRIWTKE
jgi:hypothetical protein